MRLHYFCGSQLRFATIPRYRLPFGGVMRGIK
jgi:hypothetical protein